MVDNDNSENLSQKCLDLMNALKDLLNLRNDTNNLKINSIFYKMQQIKSQTIVIKSLDELKNPLIFNESKFYIQNSQDLYDFINLYISELNDENLQNELKDFLKEFQKNLKTILDLIDNNDEELVKKTIEIQDFISNKLNKALLLENMSNIEVILIIFKNYIESCKRCNNGIK